MIRKSSNLETINHFDVKDFLANYWQKKPFLIKAGIPGVETLISPEELAGLACEEEVESRLITHWGEEKTLSHGPIDENVFTQLPESHWTLLVQAVDQWVPEVESLLNYFQFLPRWRIEDVMVSFAACGGTVSQHFDYYDVFLIQGKGSRKWQVGQKCDSDSELVPDDPMKVLTSFEAIDEWVLNPGDILYIPPQFSHYGVALEDCITYSVGCRAPSHLEIVDGIAMSLSTLKDEDRYKDTLETLQGNHFEINQHTIDEVKRVLLACVDSDEVIKSWLGSFATSPKYDSNGWQSAYSENWVNDIHNGAKIHKNPASRFAFISQRLSCLYVDGLSYNVSLELAKAMCGINEVDASSLDNLLKVNGAANLIEQLLSCGALLIDEEE